MKNPIRVLLPFVFGAALLAACGTPQVPTAEFDLTVTLAGTGTGVVTSAPAGIDTAAADFEATFDEGTVVTLTAVTTGASIFAGFSGVTCGATSTATTCVVTMNADKDVTATFNAPTETATLGVTVEVGGAAAGSVVSVPAGIDTVASENSAVFDVGTEVTLTATVDAEFFAGWTGGQCDGLKTLTCDLTIVSGQSAVVANFNEATTVTMQVTAEGDAAEEFLSASVANAVRWPAGHTYVFSDDLELGFDPQHAPQAIGLRFPGVTVPAGAVVLDAELGFTAFALPTTGTATDVALTIRGAAVANRSVFVGDPNSATEPNPPSFGVTSLPTTTADVAWTITGAWNADQDYTTPDVAAIVREILAVDGWASGNAMVFVVRPVDESSTAYRRAYASELPTDPAPTLTVRYVSLP